MATKGRSGALTVGWRVMWRQLGSNPSVVMTIFVAVLLTAIFLAATPRLFEQTSNEALRDAISRPSPQPRNIAVGRATRIGAATLDDPFARVGEAGERFATTEMPASLSSIISDQAYLVDTAQFGVFPMPGKGDYSQGRLLARGSSNVCMLCSDYLPDEGPFPSFVRLRYQEHIEDRFTLVEGALPGPRDPLPMLLDPQCPEDPKEREELEESTGVDCLLQDVPVYEVAMTAETLSVLSFGLGDMVILKPDIDDPLFSAIASDELDYQLILSVSGVIELTDPEEDYWYGDTRLHRASITENADVRIIFATGLMNADDYRRLLADLSPANWQYTWRYFLDSDLVEIATIQGLTAGLRSLEVEFHSVGSQTSGDFLVTLLPTLIDGHLAERAVTMALMSMALSGVFAIAAVLILELAGLVTMRQRIPIVLIRNRGASRGQLTLTRVYQGLLLTGPAVALGYLLAQWLIPETANLVPYRATVALLVVTTVTFVLASVPLIYRRLGSLQRERTAPLRASRTRMVFEMLVVVIAIGSVITVRRRGQIDSAGNSVFDPLMAAVPAMLAVAVGIVTLRIYPYLISTAAWLVSKRGGVVAFVGFRRILQQPSVARVPLVVILMAVAVAVFSAVIRTSISEGQQDSAWQQVAADYTITGRGPGSALPMAIDLTDIDSIRATAAGARYSDARALIESSSDLVEFLAIDSIAYDTVVDGTPADPELPSFMLVKAENGVGSGSLAIPVIVSNSGWQSDRTPAPGDTFILDLGRLKPLVVVEGVRDRFPGLPIDRPFVIADITPIEMVSAPIAVNRTILYVKAPKSASTEIAATVAEQSRGARFMSRYAVLNDVANSPLAIAVDRGLAITVGISIAFAIVAAISSVSLSSAIRRRDFGYLRTLGLRSRQATGLTAIEQIPLFAVATAVGSMLGVGMVFVLQPAINLEAFTGGSVAATIPYDSVAIVALFLLLFSALAIAATIFVLVNRGDDLGRLLRVGEE